MKDPHALGIIGLVLSASISAAQQPQQYLIVGRWDLTVTDSSHRYPSWLEVERSGDRTLVGRFVGVVGSARPISKVELKDSVFRFSVPPQWEQGDSDVHVEGVMRGEQLSGWLTDPAGKRYTWTAKRATRLAIISVGYADGFLRAASASDEKPGAEAIVAGQRCPIAGRVSMDLIAVDVTDVELTGTTGAYGRRLRAAVVSYGATGRGALTGLFALGVHDVDVLTQRSRGAKAGRVAGVRHHARWSHGDRRAEREDTHWQSGDPWNYGWCAR